MFFLFRLYLEFISSRFSHESEHRSMRHVASGLIEIFRKWNWFFLDKFPSFPGYAMCELCECPVLIKLARFLREFIRANRRKSFNIIMGNINGKMNKKNLNDYFFSASFDWQIEYRMWWTYIHIDEYMYKRILYINNKHAYVYTVHKR